MIVRIAAARPPEYRDDVEGAVACLIDNAARAEAAGARLLCFPEGFLQGYLLDPAAARRVAFDFGAPAFRDLLGRFPRTGPLLVVGVIEIADDKLYNAAIVVDRGRLLGRYRKTHLLPSETAFAPGTDMPVFDVDGLRFGINICFDTNFTDVARAVADQGATLLVCAANNMLPAEKALHYKDLHNAIRGERCRETGLWMISSDITGARDGRIAWGPTAVLAPDGGVAAQLELDEPGLLVFDLAT